MIEKSYQVQSVYLNELHYSAVCEKVTTPNDRRSIKLKHCFKCLTSGHQLNKCKYPEVVATVEVAGTSQSVLDLKDRCKMKQATKNQVVWRARLPS